MAGRTPGHNPFGWGTHVGRVRSPSDCIVPAPEVGLTCRSAGAAGQRRPAAGLTNQSAVLTICPMTTQSENFLPVRPTAPPQRRPTGKADGGASGRADLPVRRAPAKGVHVSLGGPNWVFLTVCAENRQPWLAQAAVQRALHQIWQTQATAWLVSDYLLMPDHLHLFCAPSDLRFTIERWMSFWKDRFAKTVGQTCRFAGGDLGKFQAGGFHHRLRDGESYAQKWQYVRENPVRAGLVARPEDWPYFGRVHEIRWAGP